MDEFVNSALICGNEINRLDISSIVKKLRILSQQIFGKVFVICIGHCDSKILNRLIESGAHKIIYSVSERTSIRSCEKLIIENKIGLITFLDSYKGKELASILATRLGGGLTADCIDIEYGGNGKFIFSRVAVNDSVIAKIICTNTNYQMCTIKKNTFQITQERKYCDGEVIEYFSSEEELDLNSQYKVIDRVLIKKRSNNDIDTTDIVFGIGRGIKSSKTLNRLKEVAEKCSARIGGTRACVEDNLISEEFQIGQSGISISPKIYVAFGISGASQHIVGLKNARKIISVNNNQNAPIIDYSDYVLIGDTTEVIEELLQALQEEDLKLAVK